MTTTITRPATGKQIAEYDAATVVADTDLLLIQPGPVGTVYKKLEVSIVLDKAIIRSSTTLNVGSTYGTIAAALLYLDDYRIASGATVTISVADGTHVFATGVSVTHPDSDRIQIIGNVANPAACKLRVTTNTITLFHVGAGRLLSANGFQVEHTETGDRENTIAFLADEGGYINLGAAMIVDGFFWNLFARRGGSSIRAEAGGIYRDAGDANALAYQGGHIDVAGCSLTGADDALSTLGSGAVAEGGTIDLTDAVLTGTKRAGLHLISGYVRAGDTDFSSNTGPGILHSGGDLDLTSGCTAGANGTYGYHRANGAAGTSLNLSTLSAGVAGANTSGLYSPFIEPWYSSQPGMRVVSPNANESVRYDLNGTGSHYFNTGGGLQLEIANLASAVNRVVLRGSVTGGVADLSVDGSNTNAPISVSAKGTGSVRLRSNGANALLALSDSSAVNYISVRSRATGTAPLFESAGTDTNIDISFLTKGTGNYTFLTGGGLQVRIADLASAVNYLRFVGSVTGGVADVSVDGSDTNAPFSVSAKGTGSVRLRSNGANAFLALSESSAVNQITARARATGGAAQIEATGTDADIDLALESKGSGYVRLGTHAGLAGETLSGYITIKDSGGTVRKLAVVS
jgi:hypothetical protein